MAISRLAWAVLALTFIGALGSLFGPQERWWGLDIGSLGATVFGFMLWIGAGLFAAYPERIFSPGWSLAERRAWTGLFFVVLILLGYLRFMWALGQLPEIPDTLHDLPADNFLWNLAVLLIAWAVVSSALRGRDSGMIEADERDLRLRSAADRAGDWAMTIQIVWCVGLLIGQPAERLSWWLAPMIAANLLVGVLIAKTLVEHAYLVARYAWDRR
jgi:hypothetical protein